MKTLYKLTTSVVTLAVLLSLTACSGMTTREKNTAVGAGVGAVTGSAVTGGSTAGTIGGAAVGGIIGSGVR